MSDDKQNLWESRTLPDGITLELRAGGSPALVLSQGENRVQVELAHVKAALAYGKRVRSSDIQQA